MLTARRALAPARVAALVLAALAVTACSGGGGRSEAEQEVFERLDCADRDLSSEPGEEQNDIFLCASDARVQDIVEQTDRYETLTDEVLATCTKDRSAPGRGDEIALCLLDAGL